MKSIDIMDGNNMKHYSLAAHLARNFTMGIIFIALALYMGMCGYHYFEGMSGRVMSDKDT